MLCILYVNALAACLGLAALLYERTLSPGAPRRWAWALAIGLSMVVPPVYRARHASTVPSHEAMDPTWWTRIGTFDAPIMRVWLIVTIVLFAWGLLNVVRVALLMRRARGRQYGAPARLDGVDLLVTDAVGPATVGFWKSRVLVPRWVLALPGAQRRYILRHEEEHRRAHDAHLLMAMSLTLVVTPWNLALWWLVRRLSLAVEVDCDQRVVARLGDANAYGELLLSVAETAARGPRLQPALLGGSGMLERRLRQLLVPVQLPRVQRALIAIAALALLSAALWLPHPVVKSTSAAHVTTSSATTHSH